jgi:hypothetical protein
MASDKQKPGTNRRVHSGAAAERPEIPKVLTVAEELSAEQYESFLAEELSRPIHSSMPPKTNFMQSEEVKRLSDTQRATREKISNLLLLVPGCTKL